MDRMINVVQPTLGERELAAVREVFESNWIGRGARTGEFEAAFARHLGVDPGHVTSTNSCTSATFIAMELLGVGPGDEVVLPTVSFVGVGNAIAARGARPVFCDVDEATLNPSAADVEAVLTERTKAVVILHYGGHPGAVAEIAELCRARGVRLVEDAALAVASTVDGRACGTFGDMGVWSFDHAKILVTVDGGMLYVRDPELAARAPKIAYFGLEQGGPARSGSSTSFHSGYDQALRSRTRWWDYDVTSFSGRSTTNDVLSAIGSVQLSRLGEFVARRHEVARAYDEGLAGVAGLLVLRWTVAQLRGFLLILLVSLFLSFALEPAVDWLSARGMRRGLATGLVMLSVLVGFSAFLGLLGQALFTQVSEFADDLPNRLERVEEIINERFDANVDLDELIEEDRRRAIRRRILWGVGVGLAAAAIVLAGWLGYRWTQMHYYVGVSDGNVAIFRGVQQSIGPISLSHVHQTTAISIDDLPLFQRDAVESTISADSLRDAQQIVDRLSASAGD